MVALLVMHLERPNDFLRFVKVCVRGRDKMLRNSPCTDTDNLSDLRIPGRRRARSCSFVLVCVRLCSFVFVPSSSRTEQEQVHSE